MRLRIFGIVQGVGFRPSVYNVAKGLGLAGYVCNMGANVEVAVDGDHELFLEELKKALPPLARIDNVEVEDFHVEGADFSILFSKEGSRASVIPSDTAICDNCVDELRDAEDRRFGYPFINCTDCGARYSLIADVPYDREKTSMSDFEMCPDCLVEYRDPGNRRFHAQTTSCPQCGPKYVLHIGDRVVNDQEKCFIEFASCLIEGKVGVLKSWGGMHICGGFDAVDRLRELYHRPQKPFAVLMRDMEAVLKYADPTPDEIEHLTSVQRPIVLVRKKEKMKGIAPDLDTVGMMLPYSPAHYLLFKYYDRDGIVATSANLPGEPICMENSKVFDLDLDMYLLHNRGIIQRVDDTVMRVHNGGRHFIRKSRGFIPDPLTVEYDQTIVSVGAEENVAVSVSRKNKLFLSQYIGNTKHYETGEFLKEAYSHMKKLLGVTEPDIVVRDMHPKYATRRTADELGGKIVDIPHHWAHGVSLMMDNEVKDRTVVLSLDGSGWGPDGTIWGGEVLDCTFLNYKRIGHLEHIPLLGGEKAIREPDRLVLALGELTGTGAGRDRFDGGFLTNLPMLIDNGLKTSSMGRVLDALSAYFRVCRYRSYSGEPAMKLERLLSAGKKNYAFEFEVVDGVIRTVPAFRKLFQLGKPEKYEEKCDLAYSFVSDLVYAMTRYAYEYAVDNGIKYIGLTGGVTYNEPITRMFVECTGEFNDLEIILHHNIPNGDGGICVGQNVIAGEMLKRSNE